MTALSSQLDYALAYAARGMRVFPVSPRKIPLIPWKDGASTDPAVIEGWWRAKPHAEIGWAIGPDVVALDADQSQGQRGVTDLERMLGMSLNMLIASLVTPIASTPSGGVHVFFASSGRVYRNCRIPGTAIDVKGCNSGYVVLPGYANGRQWLCGLDAPPMPAPDWLAPMLKKPPLVLVPQAVLAGKAPSEGLAPDPFARRRALAMLSRACGEIAGALPGHRDTTRHRWCFHLGGLIERGELLYPEVYDAVLRAMSVHPPRHDLEARVARSIECGMEHPLPISETEIWLRHLRARLAERRRA
jgi:hypothetical protein